MTGKKEILQASQGTDKWLKAQQKAHVTAVQNSIKTLQKDILNSLNILSMNPNGKLDGVKTNLANAQKLHAKIETLFSKDFNAHTKKVIKSFKSTEGAIIKNFSTLGEAAKFTGVDKTMMHVLRDGYYADYLAIGDQAKQKVVQSMYNNVIGNGQFSDLVNEINAALVGSKAVGVVGSSLAQYSRLYARDMIMNYHGEVMLKKADDLGMDTFLFSGTIMGGSRKFCRRRVGNPYTRNEIASWKYKWQGKSGPALSHRGGYNCRHHWQPVRKQWLDENELANLDKLSKLNKKGMPIPPKKVKPAPVVKPPPKPKPKPVVKPAPVVKPIVKEEPLKLKKKPVKPVTGPPTLTAIDKKLKSLESYGLGEELSTDLKYYQSQTAKLTTARDKSSAAYRKAGAVNNSKEESRYLKAMQALSSNEINLNKTRRSLEKLGADELMPFIRPPAGGTLKLITPKHGTKMMTSKFEKAKREVEKMYHPDVLNAMPGHSIQYTKGVRASYHNNGSNGGWLSMGNADIGTVIHEYSHGVEYHIKGLQKKANAFLKKRAGDSPITAIYKGTPEMGWEDGFFNHYCGKLYDTISSGPTELVSMGVQQMHAKPMAFFKQDPEYFKFILDIMWGTI